MAVPSGVFDWTWTGSWKVAVLPDATVGLVQVTVPFAPTAGAEQLHPAGAVIDRKTVWAGSGSVIVAEAASSGPALCTVMLYVMPPPGLMEPEPVVLEMDRSAVGGAAWLGVAMATASALITKNPVRTRRAPLATLMSPSSPAPRPRPVCGGFLMVEPRHPAAPGRERSNPGTGEVTLSGPSGFPERSPLGRCRVDPAVADRQDAVDVLQELLAVGGHQAGGSVGGDLSEGPEDFAGPPLVLVTGGLVGQQEPGADHHGPAQGRPSWSRRWDRRRGSSTFSSTESSSSSPRSWGTMARSDQGRTAARPAARPPARPAPSPAQATSPPSGCSHPQITFSRVVFPEPEGPTRATTSPTRSENVTPASARTSSGPRRYDFRRSRASNSTPSAVPGVLTAG